MYQKIKLFFVVIIVLIFVDQTLSAQTQKKNNQIKKHSVDYVNPSIGTISHGQETVTAEAYLPHSMVHISANTVDSNFRDKYFNQKIYSFPFGPGTFMPVSDKYSSSKEDCASAFDRDFEVVKPWYISENLDDSGIFFEASVSQKSLWARFKFPEDKKKYLMYFLPGKGVIEQVDSMSVHGWSVNNNFRKYFHLQFSSPIRVEKVYNDTIVGQLNSFSGKDLACAISISGSDEISMKAGMSYIDAVQAKKNISNDMGTLDFDGVTEVGKKTWENEFNKIEVQSDNSDQKTVFYTALYRALNCMINITEDGRYYSVFDKKIHDSEGRDFYISDPLWDSYRDTHPLQFILDPKQQEDQLESYARMYEQSGIMPLFPTPGGEAALMSANHIAAFAAEAWFRGYRNFDLKTVYEGTRKNALEMTMLPQTNGPKTQLDDFYHANGYYPALKETDVETEKAVNGIFSRQAVSLTLEHSTDDYYTSLLAKELGLKDDADMFMKKASNFKNVFNPKVGFMAPKMANGEWVPNFNPITSGGQCGWRYYTEANGWVYSFHVQHDVKGLIKLHGSNEAFVKKLDSLFTTQFDGYKYKFLYQFSDMTGPIGLAGIGNEPTFHIPYLYCYAGQPWKTQRLVRQIADTWFVNHPYGLCGDDDKGALSSWYIFAALGFYPVNPGIPYYVIGSPLFPKTTLKLANGKTFSVVAQNVTKQNKYIQSATVRGVQWNKPWFSHEDMMKGGEMVFVMGPKPNKLWGSSPDAVPPSMTE